MRVLGMTAAFMTLAAAVLNIIWFTRHGFSLKAFFSVTWPAALGAVGFIAGAILLGVVSVRIMLRADEEAEREQDPGSDVDAHHGDDGGDDEGGDGGEDRPGHDISRQGPS